MKGIGRVRNVAAKELATAKYGQRVVHAAKGKGSYSRKGKAQFRMSGLRLPRFGHRGSFASVSLRESLYS